MIHNPPEVYTPQNTIVVGADKYHRLRNAGAQGNQILVANTIYAIPFYVPRALTLSAMVIRVTTLDAGKIARLGIYKNGVNLYPGLLLKDFGTVSVAAVAVVEVAGAQQLRQGLYYAVVVSDGAPTIRYATAVHSVLGLSASTFADVQMWTKAAVGSGALAGAFVGGASVQTSAAIDLVFEVASLD